MNQVNSGNDHVSVAPMSVLYTHALQLYHTDNICMSFDLSKIRYVTKKTEMDPISNVSTSPCAQACCCLKHAVNGPWSNKDFVQDLLISFQMSRMISGNCPARRRSVVTWIKLWERSWARLNIPFLARSCENILCRSSKRKAQ
jgi:hypothetical protein